MVHGVGVSRAHSKRIRRCSSRSPRRLFSLPVRNCIYPVPCYAWLRPGRVLFLADTIAFEDTVVEVAELKAARRIELMTAEVTQKIGWIGYFSLGFKKQFLSCD